MVLSLVFFSSTVQGILGRTVKSDPRLWESLQGVTGDS